MQLIPNCCYRISAKALILDDQKRFLLTKEDNGLREFPGGWLDFGENPQECIQRELLEEMGIHVKWVSKTPSYFVTSTHTKWHWVANILYETQVDREEIFKFTPSEECQEVKFFTKEEAAKEKLFSNVKEFIKQFDPTKHSITTKIV